MSPSRLFDDDVKRGLGVGAAIGALALAGFLLWMPRPSTAPVPPPVIATQTPEPVDVVIDRHLDLGDAPASPDATRLARWVVSSADNGTRPFVILDKRAAHVFVFEPSGKLIGDSPVLLGYARGDDTVPGIGDRPLELVKPHERTTPAGRFVSELGLNTRGERVVWVDYVAAVSMHPVRLTTPSERRAHRLATVTPADNRISYGCINLPPDFYAQVLLPTMQTLPGVVYVMPETKKLEAVFPGLSGTT
jgi:hypothetical protein